ncbi:type II toxin-antitoxin system RelE/ParE family toxin [Tsukamurella sp. PLM1]|uniref:type II toxin-antitoxin system RelE family toxin n=1 Tax=Tsukamurella sp. PLM1 TaxID=2929795 RepID=UPI00205F65C9|nr:type II toxin-antitoxin system RelE/ParE family toxin [Tsukamurella sp. PLM1]BDH56178.1 hypothetical protein MTP03_11170 [Tsukamurella sp. PLM1]
MGYLASEYLGGVCDSSWTASAARQEIRKLPRRGQERVAAVLVLLADEPRPPASKKLTGRDAWRVRTGDWRKVYEIHDDELLVMAVAAGDRRDVHRR